MGIFITILDYILQVWFVIYLIIIGIFLPNGCIIILLDGDLASNACSWQWVAGTNSSKKYVANQDNINTFLCSNERGTFLDMPYEKLMEQDTPNTFKNNTIFNLATKLPPIKSIIINTNLPVLVYNAYNLNTEWRKSMKANRVLLLEPSHYKEFPISELTMNFILDLSQNISDIQIVVAEFDELLKYIQSENIYFVDHPTTFHYKGNRDPYYWLFPNHRGSFSSFFKFWNQLKNI